MRSFLYRIISRESPPPRFQIGKPIPAPDSEASEKKSFFAERHGSCLFTGRKLILSIVLFMLLLFAMKVVSENDMNLHSQIATVVFRRYVMIQGFDDFQAWNKRKIERELACGSTTISESFRVKYFGWSTPIHACAFLADPLRWADLITSRTLCRRGEKNLGE